MIAVVDTLGSALALSVTACFSALQTAQTVFAAIGTRERALVAGTSLHWGRARAFASGGHERSLVAGTSVRW